MDKIKTSLSFSETVRVTEVEAHPAMQIVSMINVLMVYQTLLSAEMFAIRRGRQSKIRINHQLCRQNVYALLLGVCYL